MTALISADSIGWHHDMGAGSWILMVLFWALLLAGLVWLVVSVARPRAPSRPESLEVLDRRLAEGAISVEEYHERREAITADSSRPDAPTST